MDEDAEGPTSRSRGLEGPKTSSIHISDHPLAAIGWCPNRLYARAAIWPMVTCTNHIGWKLMIISLHGDEGWYKEEQTVRRWVVDVAKADHTGHLCWPSRPHHQTITISGGECWGKILDLEWGKLIVGMRTLPLPHMIQKRAKKIWGQKNKNTKCLIDAHCHRHCRTYFRIIEGLHKIPVNSEIRF